MLFRRKTLKTNGIIDFLARNEGEYEYVQNVSAAELTSFRIGGAVSVTAYPKTEGALCALLRYLKTEEIKHSVLGNGSNVLVSDDGYDGVLVITTKLADVTFDGNFVTVGAGKSITATASAAQREGLSGLEFAYGIPGTIGGAVAMNAGAYGGEIRDVIVSAECYDAETDSVVTLTKDELALGYRDSVIKHRPLTVISARLELIPGDRAEIQSKMTDLMGRRRDKQPLEYPSAGSVFKRYPGYFTAQLIDEAGLKGCRIGGAEVSVKHAGFIVNVGGATAEDVKALVELITSKIEELHGIKIERELIYM